MSIFYDISYYQNDPVPENSSMPDGVAGLIMRVTKKSGDYFKVNESIRCMTTNEALDNLNGWNPTDNYRPCMNQVRDFFEAVGGRGELWVRIVPEDMPIAQICSITEKDAPAAKLLRDSGGRISIWGICNTTPITYTSETILDDIAVLKAFREKMSEEHIPTRIIISGRFNEPEYYMYPDLTGADADGISVTLLEREGRTGVGAVGYTLGCLARIPVHHNLGRVMNGNMGISDAVFINGEKPEERQRWEAEGLNYYGYLAPIKYTGIEGYFFYGDGSAAKYGNMMKPVSMGRVMDKIERITYEVFSRFINNDFQLSAEGKIGANELKNLQGDISEAINVEMLSKGEISGFECVIDPEQDPLTSGQTKIALRIQPCGYTQLFWIYFAFTPER